jgi:MoxR-like ATPase
MEFARKHFDPGTRPVRASPSSEQQPGDRREGDVYVYNDEIILAVNAALAIRRPLLVEGPPGSGKSSLAPHVAQVLNWDYLPRVVTSRTRAQDLLWEFDSLRRLNDAQARELQPNRKYVEPGAIWRAFDPEGARPSSRVRDASRQGEGDRNGAVVLLDEIDKADPDVPNDLLVPLGSGRFLVKETGTWVTSRRPHLLIITTNGERDLAPAFVRRCVRLKLEHAGVEDLVEIARVHFQEEAGLHRQLAEWLVREREAARARGVREPSTAEYLDAIRACLELDVTPDMPAWNSLSRSVLKKVDSPEEGTL